MDKPKMSEAKRRANKKWNDANMAVKYDHLHVIVPKGRKKAVEAFAKEHGETVNGMTNRLYKAELGMSDEEWKRGEDDE